MIHVLGANGMLGRYVYDRFYNLPCKGYSRNEFDVVTDINNLSKIDIKSGDTVINCIGVIKPQIQATGDTDTFLINGYFPYVLANYCNAKNARLIHITTDCVYSGKSGRYHEISLCDQLDTYGLSKRMAEFADCSIIRTSIIGEECGNSRSLMEWLKANQGKEVNGYTDHFWNGVTCHELSRIIYNVIDMDYKWKGVRHIHSANSVSKYELLNLINNIYGLNIKINAIESGNVCDRTLDSVYNVSRYFCNKEISQQIQEMKDDTKN